MRGLLVLALLLLIVSPAQAAKLPQTCGLLTNKEVHKALGAKIQTRSARDDDDHIRSCSWTSVPLGNFTNAQPVHSFLTVQVAPTTRSQFEEEARRSPGAFRVRRLGQEAFGTPPGNVVLLRVLSHGVALTLIATSVSSPLSVEEGLAKIALTKL